MTDSFPPAGSSRFEQTQWSLVLAAGHGDGSGAEAALAQLCQKYWYPLYGFVRRQGVGHHDAQDLTQAFFGKLLEKNYVGDAARERGRFRTFLLASLKHFLANEWDRLNARKRGGGIVFIPFDADAAARYEREMSARGMGEGSPEDSFDRRWAHAVLERGLLALRSTYVGNGQGEVFEALKPCLTQGKGAVPYAAAAARLGMDENAVKVSAHRLRRRYREALRAEIAETVAQEEEVEEEEVEEEFRHLREILARA